MWPPLLLLLFVCLSAQAQNDDSFANAYKPTNGELLPRPHVRNVEESFRVVTTIFEFQITGKSCDIIENATARYKNFMLSDEISGWKAWDAVSDHFNRHSNDKKADLDFLSIDLINPCERLPHLHMNENYNLKISDSSAVLTASHVWGILRGLETFYQLLTVSSQGLLVMKCQEITDSPRFPYRGLFLDTASVYLPVSDILLTLDAMSYTKLNVFHWHIVGDRSFPFVSMTHPELSAKGAFNRTMIYTQKNIRQIVEYARLRGIRVIPEFDTPGHTASWGLSHPEILTKCYKNGKPDGKLGPINPLKSEAQSLIRDLYSDVFFSFPDHYVHAGGEKFAYDCWASNPEIQKRAQDHNYNHAMIEAEFNFNLLPILAEANRSFIAWANVYNTMMGLPKDTIIQVANKPWRKNMIDIVNDNHYAVLSTCLNLKVPEMVDRWDEFYECDPTGFDGTPKMKSLVLGGEITVRDKNKQGEKILGKIWPRASAAAESLWSQEKEDIRQFSKRLHEHICRLKRRGLPAESSYDFESCVY